MTVDPFYTTSTAGDDLHHTLDQIRDFDPERATRSAITFTQVHSTYEPTRAFKTFRILAMHLWVLTSRKETELKNLSDKSRETLTIADQIEPELESVEHRITQLKSLPEQTKPVKDEIEQKKKHARALRDKLKRATRSIKLPVKTSSFVDALQGSHCPNLDSLCQALAKMDQATTRDVSPLIEKHDALTSPVRAEMFQHLSSAWDMTPSGPSILGDSNMILGTSRLDPGSDASQSEHFVLMPLLIPYKHGVEVTDFEPIPLLWTTNINHDPFGYAKRPGRVGSKTIVHGSANYISVKPPYVARGQAPQWKYAIVAIPVDKGPTTHDAYNPAICSFNPGDSTSPFEFAAGLWHINRLTAAVMGMQTPVENMDHTDGLLWGADLPLIARAAGWPAARAAALHDTLNKPCEAGTKRRPWTALQEPTPEMLASPHMNTSRHLISRYRHDTSEMGKWGALVSGLRYLPLAWRSGFMSAIPGLTGSGAVTMGALNRPTDDLLESVRKKQAYKKYKVTAHTRKTSDRQAASARVKATDRAYTPPPLCDADIIGAPDFLRVDALTKRDVTVARDMLAPLVAECLCKFIDEIEAGDHGSVTRSWMHTAMDMAETEAGLFVESVAHHMRSRAQSKGNAINYAGDQIKGI